MIGAISNTGMLNALYPQYNVSKIQRVKKLDETASKDSVQAKEQEKELKSSIMVSEELRQAKQVSYSENPYEQSRKLAESTLLVGQNFDVAV